MYLSQAVLNAKLQINDIVPSVLAAAEAVLTPQQKELGVALIDMGSDTTSIAVFEEGDLVHLAIFPLGSANITKDIAIGLRTEFAVAEDIKKQHGLCMLTNGDKLLSMSGGKNQEKNSKNPPSHKASAGQSKIEVFDKSSSLSFTQKDLVGIIEPRVSEILELMQKELKKIGRQELLPAGIVVTGGGAKLPKIKELVRQQLKLPCEMGVLKGIVGIEQDPALATVVGLVLGGTGGEGAGSGGILGLGFIKKLFSKIKKMFRVFIP